MYNKGKFVLKKCKCGDTCIQDIEKEVSVVHDIRTGVAAAE
jgi:hypothetical protein